MAWDMMTGLDWVRLGLCLLSGISLGAEIERRHVGGVVGSIIGLIYFLACLIAPPGSPVAY